MEMQMHGNSKILRFAAIMTWVAAFVSEWFDLMKGNDRYVFAAFAIAFIAAFIWLEQRPERKGFSPALMVQIVGATGAVYFGGFGVTPALYVILGVALVERLPRHQFWIVMILINSVLFYKLVRYSDWAWALTGFAAYGGFQIFGMVMAGNASALAKANQDLMASNAELVAARSLLAESERASERMNLSRELHDVCGHKLTALKLTMRQAGVDGTLSGESLALSQQLADEILSDIRSVVSTLRQYEGIDLRASLMALCQSWQKPLVSLHMSENLKVNNLSIAHTLLRVAQEATTNAAKHGLAKMVRIELVESSEALEMRINDDGKTPNKITFGNGLNGMKERLAAHSGTLSIDTQSGSMKIIARIPISAEAL
jgi:signal transduction histidine kinase